MSDFGISLKLKRISGEPCTEKDVNAVTRFFKGRRIAEKNRLNEPFEWAVRLNEFLEPISVGVTVTRYWTNDLRDIHGIDLHSEEDVKEFLMPDLAKVTHVQEALTAAFGDQFTVELYAGGW